MTDPIVLLAIVGVIAGLLAAWFWLRASKINFEAWWTDGQRVGRLDPLRDPGHWAVAISKTLKESGKLNSIAALLTAIAVIAGGASALLSSLAATCP